MKIYFNLDLDPRKFEGRTKLSVGLRDFLMQNGHDITNNPNEADILHFHSSGVFESYRAYKLKKQLNKPCIYTLYSTAETHPINHIINFYDQRKYFSKTATNGLLSYSAIIPLKFRSIFLKKLDKLVVPLNYMKQKLFSNTEVISFGVDVNKFIPSKNENKKVKVAYFGHPSTFKGMNDFIEASKHFSEEVDIELYPSVVNEKLKALVATNPRIKLMGYVEDIVAVYNSVDIVVLPYRMSLGTVANPLVLLEAMSSGKCIITTNLKEYTEIVQDSCYLVDPFSPKQIADAVNSLAKDESLRKKLGENARQRIVNSYDENVMFKKYLQLYESLK